MLPWDTLEVRGREKMTTSGWTRQGNAGFVLEMSGKFIQMVVCRLWVSKF